LSVTVALAAIEWTARAIWPSHHSADTCMRPDLRTIYSHAPNCRYTAHIPEGDAVEYRYDECGLRNGTSCRHLKNQSPLIAFIGDSFTEGMAVSVEQGFVWQTGQELHRHGVRAEVLNFGVSGYDLLQYHEVLASALAFKPHVVIVGLLPNDLFDGPSLKSLESLRSRLVELGPEFLMREKERSWRPEGLLARVRRLLSYSTAATMFQHYLFTNDTLYLSTYMVRGHADFLQRSYSADWDEKIAGAAELLENMRKSAEGAGARLVVLLIPQRIQAAMIAAQALPQHLDPGGLPERLQHAIGEHVDLVNFLDVLRGHADPSSLYFPVDGHLTTEGHHLLGATLAGYVVSSGLLNRTNQEAGIRSAPAPSQEAAGPP
jgi:hypothetical protein